MDEFAIPIYGRGYPEHLLKGYEFLINIGDKIPSQDGRHDVSKIPEMYAFDIRDEGIRDAFRYNPVRNDGIVLPRIVDISLKGYDIRKSVIEASKHNSFHTDVDWVQWMIRDSTDQQPLKILIDENHSRVVHSLFNCQVKIDAKKADTLSYHVEAVEDQTKACLHTKSNICNHLMRMDLFHAAQEIAYVIKPTYQLIVHSERASTSENFEIARQNVITLRRGHRVQMGDEAYAKLIQRLVRLTVQGNVPRAIQSEMEQLEAIRSRWASGRYDPVHVNSQELCRILSRIGRIMLDQEAEPVDEGSLSLRFQQALDEKFRLNDSERNKIFEPKSHRKDEDRFYVLLVIAASDTNNSRIWWSNPYPCLRGALIAAESKLGDVYFTLRSWYDWSVRSNYAPRERERETEKYIFSRVNLFDYDAGPSSKIIHWEYQLYKNEWKVTLERGNACDLYPDSDEDVIVTKFDEAKYIDMVGEIIDGGWNEEEFKMYKLLQSDGNVLTIDFEKDAKLNSTSEVILPDYYNKWIIAPMFNSKLRITETEIATNKSDDPMIKRSLKPMTNDPVDLQRYTLARYYDVRPGIMGRSLARKQTQSTFDAKISEIKDYDEVIARFGVLQKPTHPCMTLTGRYVLEKISLLLISVLRYHADMEADPLEEFTHPQIDLQHKFNGSPLVDLSQTVIYLIDYLYERRSRVRSVFEARYIFFKLRSAVGSERLDLIRYYFPAFAQKIAVARRPSQIKDLMVLNLLPLFFLIGDNMIYKHRQWSIPLLLYADQVKVIPLEVGSSNNRQGLVSYLEYMCFFPSLSDRESTVDEAMVKVSAEVVNYYLKTTISDGGVNFNVVSTKSMLLDTYLSSICGGISDGVVWYLPVTHPYKCVVAIEVCDDKVPAQLRCERIKLRFPLSSQHLKGIVVIRISENGKFEVFTEGIVTHRICKKSLLKHVCDIILLKFHGHVFGNDEMLTKLLNV
uniref:Outer capsid protein VP2 n=1 Tax=Bluetongue virus 2 TaxID=35328 RepID=A0A1B4ZZ97_BTV|nr:VP2 protein [Bluetongue virus 2]